eukprot:scaffold81391_cov44-Tisochrysis_lutea.AAC.1
MHKSRSFRERAEPAPPQRSARVLELEERRRRLRRGAEQRFPTPTADLLVRASEQKGPFMCGHKDKAVDRGAMETEAAVLLGHLLHRSVRQIPHVQLARSRPACQTATLGREGTREDGSHCAQRRRRTVAQPDFNPSVCQGWYSIVV